MGDIVQAGARPALRRTDGPASRQARHRGLALGLILLAQLLVVIDVSIVTLALPSIQRKLGFSPVSLQWVISAYALAFGGFLLLGGRSADLLGRRRVLIAGVGVFTAASLACGLARSAGVLIAARAVEGLGAAMMAPAALALILAMFPEGAERNKALGAFGAVTGAGGAIGVLAGGMLTTWLSWPWIFFVNLPVGVLIVAGARPLLPESRADLGHRRFDIVGAVTVTGGLSLLVYAVATAGSHGWASAITIGLLGGAAALLAAFILIEARSMAPLLPLSFFRNLTVAGANLAGLLLGAVMFPMFVFLSLYMQQVLGYSAIRTGLAFLVIAVGMIVSSGLAQNLVTRAGTKLVLTAGLLGFAAAQMLFLRLPVSGGFAMNLLPGFLLVAIALGLAFVGDFIASTAGTSSNDAGLASGLINTSQQIGGAIGLAVTTTIAATHTAALLRAGDRHAAALTGGFRDVYPVTGALAIAAAIVAATLIRRTRPAGEAPPSVPLTPPEASYASNRGDHDDS
jgi:EmrB/QacA subfamily drug resistance transporter